MALFDFNGSNWSDTFGVASTYTPSEPTRASYTGHEYIPKPTGSYRYDTRRFPNTINPNFGENLSIPFEKVPNTNFNWVQVDQPGTGFTIGSEPYNPNATWGKPNSNYKGTTLPANYEGYVPNFTVESEPYYQSPAVYKGKPTSTSTLPVERKMLPVEYKSAGNTTRGPSYQSPFQATRFNRVNTLVGSSAMANPAAGNGGPVNIYPWLDKPQTEDEKLMKFVHDNSWLEAGEISPAVARQYLQDHPSAFSDYYGVYPGDITAVGAADVLKSSTPKPNTSFSAPDVASRGTRDEYDDYVKRGTGFKGYSAPAQASMGYVEPPSINKVTGKVASSKRNTPSTSTLRQPDSRWVQDVPSYTYAYQNTPAPAVQQPTPEQQYVNSQMSSPEYGTYDYYKKYVLRG